jgi:hypothetical protein
MYINKEGLDFSSIADLTPTQEFELSHDPNGELEYPTKYNKFQNVHHLTLFFSDNHGGDTTKLFYIQLNGEDTKTRHGVVIATYEVKPNVSENKNVSQSSMPSNIS